MSPRLAKSARPDDRPIPSPGQRGSVVFPPLVISFGCQRGICATAAALSTAGVIGARGKSNLPVRARAARPAAGGHRRSCQWVNVAAFGRPRLRDFPDAERSGDLYAWAHAHVPL